MKGTFYNNNNKNKFMNRAELCKLSDSMTVFTYISTYYIKNTLYNMYILFVLIYNITFAQAGFNQQGSYEVFFDTWKTQFSKKYFFISYPCGGGALTLRSPILGSYINFAGSF